MYYSIYNNIYIYNIYIYIYMYIYIYVCVRIIYSSNKDVISTNCLSFNDPFLESKKDSLGVISCMYT